MRVKSAITALAFLLSSTAVHAQVFEIIHPEAEKGTIEAEVLTGGILEDVEDGDENTAAEFSLGYGLTDFWSSSIGIEIVGIEAEDVEAEAVEWENVFVLTKAEQLEQAAGGKETFRPQPVFFSGFTAGVYTNLEIPINEDFDEGSFTLGPIWSNKFGPLEFTGNTFFEIPFEDGEDVAFQYGAALAHPLSDNLSIGLEAFGEIESAFDNAPPVDEQEHFIGPALYYDTNFLGNELHMRIAALFGLTEEAADAIISVNFEYEIEPEGTNGDDDD